MVQREWRGVIRKEHSVNKVHLQKIVHELVKNKKMDEARKLVENRLSQATHRSPREQIALLDLLLSIETIADHPRAALAVLARRRTFRFPNRNSEFETTLMVAHFLMRTDQWCAARRELTELLNDAKSKTWSGILDALVAYVDADEGCREDMNLVLLRGCKAAIKMYGIPVAVPLRRSDAPKTIRHARALYRSAAKKYQRLFLRLATGTAKKKRDAGLRALKEYQEKEKVKCFVDLSRDLEIQLRAAKQNTRTLTP
jgi:hypothetical protein